jgi:hypothetical protein
VHGGVQQLQNDKRQPTRAGRSNEPDAGVIATRPAAFRRGKASLGVISSTSTDDVGALAVIARTGVRLSNRQFGPSASVVLGRA